MKKPAQKNSQTDAAPAQKSQMDYDQEVNRRAYELCEASGGQHGDDLRHWLEAEREVNARRQSSGAGSR
jgi:hypothetical protein